MIRKAEEIPLDWRPRWRIVGKEYIYTIHNDVIEDPISMRYHWHVKKPLNRAAMMEAAKALEGTHDFTTLQGANSTPANPVKTMFAVTLRFIGPTVYIHVIGDGFLYHMVRNIAGLLVDVGLGRFAPSQVPDLIAARDRRVIGKTAPPQGLCLEEIFFNEGRRQAVIESLRS